VTSARGARSRSTVRSPTASTWSHSPGTGGWGYADDEWWIVRLTGGEGQAPPLELNAGEQTLTMTGLLTTHMNIDYLLFVPHD
jgi:hypothetical protein